MYNIEKASQKCDAFKNFNELIKVPHFPQNAY